MKQVKFFEGYVEDVEKKVNQFLFNVPASNIVSIDYKPKTQISGIYCLIIYNKDKP